MSTTKTIHVDIAADQIRPDTHNAVMIQYFTYIVTRQTSARFFPFGTGRYSAETIDLFTEDYENELKSRTTAKTQKD